MCTARLPRLCRLCHLHADEMKSLKAWLDRACFPRTQDAGAWLPRLLQREAHGAQGAKTRPTTHPPPSQGGRGTRGPQESPPPQASTGTLLQAGFGAGSDLAGPVRLRRHSWEDVFHRRSGRVLCPQHPQACSQEGTQRLGPGGAGGGSGAKRGQPARALLRLLPVERIL